MEGDFILKGNLKCQCGRFRLIDVSESGNDTLLFFRRVGRDGRLLEDNAKNCVNVWYSKILSGIVRCRDYGIGRK